jgi:hypothetical protein
MVASYWLFLYNLTETVFAYFIIVTYYFNMFILLLLLQHVYFTFVLSKLLHRKDSDYTILNESIYFNLEKNNVNFISLICCIISFFDYKTAR